MSKRKHVCPNSFAGEGAKGGCYFEIQAEGGASVANLGVGWSCVVVHDGPIHVTWLAELIAIATGHKGGIKGFLEEQRYGGDSYALMCDPEPAKDQP